MRTDAHDDEDLLQDDIEEDEDWSVSTLDSEEMSGLSPSVEGVKHEYATIPSGTLELTAHVLTPRSRTGSPTA